MVNVVFFSPDYEMIPYIFLHLLIVTMLHHVVDGSDCLSSIVHNASSDGAAVDCV